MEVEQDNDQMTRQKYMDVKSEHLFYGNNNGKCVLYFLLNILHLCSIRWMKFQKTFGKFDFPITFVI